MFHLPNHYATETVFFACCAVVAAAGIVVYAAVTWFDRSVDRAVTFRSVES